MNGTQRPATHAANRAGQSVIRQRIVAVRRRRVDDHARPRRLTKDELEWIEKQLQYTQRVSLLEKECMAWWRSFFSSAGRGGAAGGNQIDPISEVWATTQAIQKQADDSERRRYQDAKELQQQLNALRSQGDAVMMMVHQMRDGTEFISSLQDAMGQFEQSLAQFRNDQRDKFDAYVIEENLLNRDLSEYLDKIEQWEQQDASAKQKKKDIAAVHTRSPTRRLHAKKKSAQGLSTSTVHEPDEPAMDESKTVNTGDVDVVKRVRRLNHQILQSGGHKGGWDDREHAQFTAMLLKYGLTDEKLFANHVVGANAAFNQQEDDDFETLVAKCLRKCIQIIVTRSENAVRNHFDWYLSHLVLLQQKKEAIAEWKATKESERQQLIQQGLQRVDAEADISAKQGASPSVEDKVHQKQKEAELKAREKKAKQVEAWREEREGRANEKLEQEREQRLEQEAREAKKRQELLEKKQQILLYKLQKEQEASLLQRNRTTASGPPGSQSPPASNKELQERSRHAIKQAKAKRAQLQALEERRQRQQQLPDRPKSVTKRLNAAMLPSDSPGGKSPTDTTLLKPTKAFEARNLTKTELQRKKKQRATQGAHDTYFPGAGVIADVKIKSFGHVPIAPRAVPSWRRNL